MANDQLIDTESGESSSETAKWVGPSCGQHGSYTFYKGVRFEYMLPEVVQSTVARERPRRGSQSSRTIYDRNSGDERILAVGDTFFVKVGNAEPTCIGELVLLWHDELNSEDLALLRLYYMPETTPAGRQSQHGEDEVLAVAEKITIRITDLPTWIIEPEEWSYGSCFFLPAISNTQPKKGQVVIDLLSPTIRKMFMSRTNVNLETVNREKEELLQNSVCEKHKEALHRTTNHVVNCEENGYQQQATTAIDATTAVEQSHSNDADSTINNNAVVCRRCDNFHRLRCKLEVVVLAFGEYCRYRTWLKQLEGMAHSGDVCLVSGKRRKIVFCRDSFEYPLVIQDPLVCEEYAPVFKGRPRKRKKNKHRFTRTKTHKTTKSTNDEENTSARRKSSRTRHRPKQINTQLLHYSMFSPNSEVKSSRGRTNSSSSSSASDTHPRNKGASNQRQNRKDLRRSKRRRNNSNSNSDFQLALQNSLMDIGSAQLCYDSQNSAESGSKSRKRKNSLISSAASGADKGLTNGQKRKRYPSSGCGSTSSDSSSNSDQLSPASPSSSIKSMSSNDVDGFGDIDDDLRDFDSNNPDSFTKALMKFMESNGTPINKIPSLGFKKLNLHEFYTFVQKEGGYQRVTDGKMWRSVYQNTGANPSSTSAATCTRRHYEKLLLPFEKYLRSKSSQLKRKRMKMKTSIDAPTSAPATTADGNKKAPKKTMAPRRQKSSRSESSTNSNSITSETITESKTVLETDKTAESSDATVTVRLESETEKEPEQSIELKTEQHSPVPASTTPAPASSADDVALDFRTPATACHRVQTMEAGDEQPLDLSVPKTTAGRNAAVVPRESTAIASSTRIAHQIPQMQMLQNGKSTWHKSTTPLNGNCWMNPRNSTSNNSNGVDKPTLDIQHHPIFSMTKSSPLTNADTIKPQNGSSSNGGGLPVHAVKPIPANTSDDPAKRAHHQQQQQVQMRTSSTTGPVQPRWPAVGGSAVNGRGTATVLPMQRTIANAMRNNEATAANQRLFPQRQQQHGIIATNSSNNSDQMNSSASSYSRPIASASALRENHHHQQQHTAPSSSSSKLAPHNSESSVRRPKESTGVHSASAGGESSARTYYRPTSMLAHHRQHKQQVSQQQQQQNAANSNNVPVGASAAASKEMQQLQNNHLHHQQPKDSASLLQSQQHKIRAQPSNAAMPMQRVLGTAPKSNPASSSNQMPPPPSRNAQHHIKSSDLEKASQQQQQRQQIMQNSNRNASAAAMNKYPNMGHQRLNNVPPDMVNFLASQAQRNDKDRGKDMIASNGGQQMQQQRTNMPPPFSHHQNHHLPAHFDASSMMLAQAAAVASVKQQQQQQSASESVGSTNHHQQQQQHHHQRQRSHDEAHSSNLIFPSQQQAPSLSGAGSRAPSDRQNNLKPQQAQYASAVAARQQQILQQQQQQAMSSSKELQHRQMSNADLREPRQALEQQRSSSGPSGYPHVQSSRPMQSPHMKPPHGEAPKSKRPQSTHAEQNATVAAAAHALHSSRATPPKRPRVFQGGNSESGIKSNIDPPQHSGIRPQWSNSDLTAAAQAQASYTAQNFNNLFTQQMMASRINLRHQLLEGNGTAAANAVGLNGRNARYSPAEAFSREKNHLAAPASNSRVDRMTSSGSNQPKPAEPARPLSFSVDRLTSPSLDKRSQQLSRDKSPHMRVNEAQKNKQQQQQPNDHRNSNLRNAQQQAAHQLAFNPATGLPSNRLAASVVPNFQLPGGLPGMPQVHLNRFGQTVISPDLMELVQSMPFLNRELLSGLNPGLLPFVANVPSGQRHPDNSSLNLPLQVDPTFLQSLPPTSAPYAAFPNPSSRSANSRTPNFRYQHH